MIHTLPEECNVYIMGQIPQSYRLNLHTLSEELEQRGLYREIQEAANAKEFRE